MCSICLMSCVSQKDYNSLSDDYEQLQDDYARLKQEYSNLQDEYVTLQDEYERLDNISETVIDHINKEVNLQVDNLNRQIITLSDENRSLKYSIWVIQEKIRYGKNQEAFQITQEILNGN